MEVDHTAWTDPHSKAGKYLADELSRLDDMKLGQRVGSYIHKFHKRMVAINGVEKEARTFYLQMLLNKTKTDIRKNFKTTKLIGTLLENLIVCAYRKELIKL